MNISNYSDVITALRKGNSFVQYDLEKEVIQGIVEYNGVVMDVAFLNTIERIVVADCMGKTMVVNSLEEMPPTHCDCIDLDSKGRRWEGSVIDNKPYGYGAIYNEEENREYEGFMLKDVKHVVERNTTATSALYDIAGGISTTRNMAMALSMTGLER